MIATEELIYTCTLNIPVYSFEKYDINMVINRLNSVLESKGFITTEFGMFGSKKLSNEYWIRQLIFVPDKIHIFDRIRIFKRRPFLTNFPNKYYYDTLSHLTFSTPVCINTNVMFGSSQKPNYLIKIDVRPAVIQQKNQLNIKHDLTIEKLNEIESKCTGILYQIGAEFNSNFIISPQRKETNLFSINLHSKIKEISYNKFKAGEYRSAIFDSLVILEETLKSKYRFAKNLTSNDTISYGTRLIEEAFRDNNPILKINNLSNDSEKDEHKAFRYLLLGAMSLKNVKSHSLTEPIDKEIAIEYLGLISLLLKKIENTKIETTQIPN
jgi:uncharacterized protein (TIGR02391 family)